MNLNEQFLINITFLCYLISTISYFLLVTFKLKSHLIIAGFSFLGFLFNVGTIFYRMIQKNSMSMTTIFEFGFCLVATIVVITLFLMYKKNFFAMGMVAFPVIIILTAVFILFYEPTKPLSPTLKSNWLFAHVTTAIIAYGCFALSFIIAVLGLISAKGVSIKDLPSSLELEKLAHRFVILGMPFLTLLMATGAIWAEYSWGSYWSWDPKETWSLITWIAYSVYIHRNLNGRNTNTQSMKSIILCFGIVMFTFLGVSLWLPGTHSY